MRIKACIPYLIIVCAVMTVYSAFLLHLSKSVGHPHYYHGTATNPSTVMGGDREGWNDESFGWGPRTGKLPPPPCSCSVHSAEGLEAGSHVAMGLSFPYRYFKSNHWFHISEYYVSRHAQVAPSLPKHATVYIVAPHALFVQHLMPMTFFLLLLAFTDGTARTARVLSREALMRELAGPRPGEHAWALDTDVVESYVYDSSLPPFNRTRRYTPGERQQEQQQRWRRRQQPQPQSREGGSTSFLEQDEIAMKTTPLFRNDAATEGAGHSKYALEEQRHRRLLRRRDVGFIAVPGGGSGSRNPQPAHEESANIFSVWVDTQDGEGTNDRDWDPSLPPLQQAQSDDEGVKEPGGRASWEAAAEASERTSAETQNQYPTMVVDRNRGWESDGSGRGDARGDTKVGERHPHQPPENGRGGASGSASAYPEPAAAAAAARATVGRKLLDGERRAGDGGASADADVESRSNTLSSTPGENGVKTCECARYVGEFGSAPVERGYWFKHGSVGGARERIDALCGDIYRRRQEGHAMETGVEMGRGNRGDAAPLAGKGRQRRLVIYQRDADRRLLDLEGNIRILQELLGSSWEVVDILHDNNHEPCWLYSQLMGADMLLTPHGFQSMLLLFLPPGATILEVFPYKYWKEGYAPLAKEWGVRHEHIMSRPVTWIKGLALFFIPLDRCMRSVDCRKWSRGADVRLEEHHLRQIAKAANAAAERKKEFLPRRSNAI